MDEGTKKIRVAEEPITLTLKKCELLVTSGPNEGQRKIMDKGNFAIGSKSDNDLIITDGTVSRKHAEIVNTQNGYLLRDLGSTNGTFVDAVRVKEAYPNPGSVIKVGNTKIEFMPKDEKISIFPSKKNKFGNMIGSSLEMRKIFGIIEKIAPTDITVIIEGETGTGKELIAEAIHLYSHRANKALTIVDCSAVAENLIESELFGHEKGAFTNAISQRKGAFEIADGGTLFLDEIGELNLELQPKLLRALESRTVKRVGGDKHIPVNVRVVAATNKSLEKEVKEGRFREDLFYRLAVVHLYIPPMRKRKDDLQLMIQHFIETYNKRIASGPKIKGVDPDALDLLKNYYWPGNVRELKNVIDRSITFCQGEMLTIGDFPETITKKSSTTPQEGNSSDDLLDMTGDDLPFKEAKDKLLEIWERDYIVKLLKKNDNNISKAAKEAGIDRKSIQRILKKYNLHAKDV